MHYQDRGNLALPIDLVNVLKSQDEGYIRTTKIANLKVSSSAAAFALTESLARGLKY